VVEGTRFRFLRDEFLKLIMTSDHLFIFPLEFIEDNEVESVNQQKEFQFSFAKRTLHAITYRFQHFKGVFCEVGVTGYLKYFEAYNQVV
jgi:hypothetical protein